MVESLIRYRSIKSTTICLTTQIATNNSNILLKIAKNINIIIKLKLYYMKYQHILNSEILFETNNAHEYMLYLMNNDKAKQAKYSVFYNLLVNANEYKCDMITGNK